MFLCLVHRLVHLHLSAAEIIAIQYHLAVLFLIAEIENTFIV